MSVPKQYGDYFESTEREQLRAELAAAQAELGRSRAQADALREALDRIARPIWWMQEDQKRQTGSINGINGVAALALAGDAEFLRGIAKAALAAPENHLDLSAAAWDEIQQAARESQWMPPEYVMNDWVSDVCRFLREAPAPQAELAQAQKVIAAARAIQRDAEVFKLHGSSNIPAVRCEVKGLCLQHWYDLAAALDSIPATPSADGGLSYAPAGHD